MIHRLRIKGFQSLADVDLPLGRFTVIQGKSNSGKSAVIRALRAVVTNAGNLRGTDGSFIHEGSKKCSVTVERDDRVLTWTKSKTKTTYELTGHNDPFQTGQDVPPAVAEFLKLGDIALDGDNKVNVNFQGGGRNQGQFEPPFLVVDRTGSFLAKVFALLTSANVLYAAQAVAKKEARSNAGKLKTLREVNEGEQARLLALQAEHAPLKVAADEAARLHAEYVAATTERDRLVATQSELARIAAELADVDAQLAHADVDFAALVAELEGHLAQLAAYSAWHQAITKVQDELAALDSEALSPLPGEVMDQLLALDEYVGQVENLRSWDTALRAVVSELSGIDEAIEQSDDAARAARAELDALLDEIGTCPTCGSGSMTADGVLA